MSFSCIFFYISMNYLHVVITVGTINFSNKFCIVGSCLFREGTSIAFKLLLDCNPFICINYARAITYCSYPIFFIIWYFSCFSISSYLLCLIVAKIAMFAIRFTIYIPSVILKPPLKFRGAYCINRIA